MKAMPLPCKIVRNVSSEVSVDIRTFGDVCKDVSSINPNSIGEVIELKWDALSYDEVKFLEWEFRHAKANERFIYNLQRYQMEDSFTINVTNNKPTVQASFRKVQ